MNDENELQNKVSATEGLFSAESASCNALLVENARIRGTSPYSYRSGDFAKITGVVICTPKDLQERACFVCEYDDGFIDYIPIDDRENYEISN